MTRKDARDFAMVMLYQIDLNEPLKEKNKSEYFNAKKLGNQLSYITEIFHCYENELETVDGIINECADNWNTSRLSKIDLAILRLAVIEIRYLDDVPRAVAINEAVELAKKYGTDESKKFINGVLSKVK
ncbi:MAG: transcription antitermination factor NusB [Clostridia bacterium]|nr:transcription antitermination factor NusB [Clostridia bacterium]